MALNQSDVLAQIRQRDNEGRVNNNEVGAPVTTGNGVISTPAPAPVSEGLNLQDLLGLGEGLAGAFGEGADIETAFLEEALALQREQFEFQKQILAPFIGVGTEAITRLGADVPGGRFDPGEFNFSFNPGDPGFQFLFEQGVNAIDAGASARGLLGSGSRLKDLTSFGIGVTSQEATNQLNRELAERQTNTDRLNSLFNQELALANIGSGSAGQQVQSSQAFANASGGLLAGIGSAQNAGVVGGASAQFGAFGDALNFQNQEAQLALQQQQIDAQESVRDDDRRQNSLNGILTLAGGILGGFGI